MNLGEIRMGLFDIFRKASPDADEPAPITCTYCRGTKFFEGTSTNILCANPECRHWFNYHGGVLPMDDLHRVEPSDAEKADVRKLAEFSKRMNVGATDYREHGSIAVLRQRQLEHRWTYPKPEQIDEICGFIMGMADDIRTLKVNSGEIHPAYGPGSITDAATYKKVAFTEVQAAARLAAFLNKHPGNPVAAFTMYMERLGTPLTLEEIELFNTEYHKEE